MWEQEGLDDSIELLYTRWRKRPDDDESICGSHTTFHVSYKRLFSWLSWQASWIVVVGTITTRLSLWIRVDDGQFYSLSFQLVREKKEIERSHLEKTCLVRKKRLFFFHAARAFYMQWGVGALNSHAGCPTIHTVGLSKRPPKRREPPSLMSRYMYIYLRLELRVDCWWSSGSKYLRVRPAPPSSSCWEWYTEAN